MEGSLCNLISRSQDSRDSPPSQIVGLFSFKVCNGNVWPQWQVFAWKYLFGDTKWKGVGDVVLCSQEIEMKVRFHI